MPPLEHEHTPEAVATRLSDGPRASYLRDWVYGAIDGAVTTFAVVAGASGAELSGGIVIVLGTANLLADGFSMAAGNFSGTRAEIEAYARLHEMERRHVALAPEGEREEIRQIYARKGFTGQALEDMVRLVTAREETWIETMMEQEHGMSPVQRSPLRAAAWTFLGFLVAGALPLAPYMLGLPEPGRWATGLTALTFFLIGSARSRWSPRPWWQAGTETFVVGLLAASVAYGVGLLLNGLA